MKRIALVLSLLPLLIGLRSPRIRLLGPAILLVAAAVMLPVSTYEASMRVVSNQRETALMNAIRGYWQARGVPPGQITVVYGPTRGPVEDLRLIGPHDLTWGYERRTPAMWTAFQDAWFAERFVSNYHHLRFLDCSRATTPTPCPQPASLCATPGVHYMDRGITVICPGTIAQ